MKKTIGIILKKCQEKGFTPAQTVKAIRPTIGLYPRQAIANWNFQRKYLSIEVIFSRPQKSAPKKASITPKKVPLQDKIDAFVYSIKQIQQRAEMLSETGMALAYHIGLQEFTRIFLSLGLLDSCEKVWVTAGDEKVWEQCGALSDKVVAFDEKLFESKYFTGIIPPAHPNCRCTIVYQRPELPEGYEKMDFEELSNFLGKLGNRAVRKWYIYHDERIHEKIDDDLPLEVKARQAFELRNLYRTQARELMADQLVGREYLNKKYPNPTFDYMLNHKIIDKGMTYEEAIQDIYNTATKSNRSVNKKLGL